MNSASLFAFVVIAVAPLIGIWRGHVWARSQGLTLRTPPSEPHSQAV